MNDNSHDRIIAKLQYFAEHLKQTQIEKESLLLIFEEIEMKNEMKKEILIYQEISREYYRIFENILYE